MAMLSSGSHVSPSCGVRGGVPARESEHARGRPQWTLSVGKVSAVNGDVPALMEKWGPLKVRCFRDRRSLERGVPVLGKTVLGRGAAAAQAAELIPASATAPS